MEKSAAERGWGGDDEPSQSDNVGANTRLRLSVTAIQRYMATWRIVTAAKILVQISIILIIEGTTARLCFYILRLSKRDFIYRRLFIIQTITKPVANYVYVILDRSNVYP